MKAKKKQRGIFNLSKEKSESRIPFPTKISFKIKGKIKPFQTRKKKNSLSTVLHYKKFKGKSSGRRKMR